MKRLPVTRAAIVAASVAGFAFVVACGDGTYLFQGRRFDRTRACLGPIEAIDVMRGDNPGTCAPRCITAPSGDAAPQREIFVAITCGKLPHDIEGTGSDPSCAPAMAAFERRNACLPDGGASAPEPIDASDADAENRTANDGG